ncbi:hypothetical protein RUM43_007886 [Polyplax serrata]|uniref:Exocyst complex component 5 n=1 Tax=Polyplax serrata TaxID=468196 RepID=A0AAN8Q6J8_POLSC
MQFLNEIDQEPFDPDEFVETLAWKTLSSAGSENDANTFDPVLLHETFTKAIRELQTLQERQKKKCEKLEAKYREEELSDLQRMEHLQERNKVAIDLFRKLDEQINFVATKVIHLGEQLESVNTPRSRAVEAQKLMHCFEDFHISSPIVNDIFSDRSKIDEAADIIQKLYSIALELPEDKFGETKKKITAKYDEIERNLIEEFAKAHRFHDIARMKEIANCMVHFKGYGQCIDAFIEYSQMQAFTGNNVFHDVLPLCEKNYKIIKEVFNNPEQVMAKFALNIYHLKLQTYISSKLADKTDTEKYLQNLFELYTNTLKLSEEMTKFDMGNDASYLNKLTKGVFHKHLDFYMSMESKCLDEKCNLILRRYYESKNHQKKVIQSGGFQDFRRDLQAVIGARANINIAQIEDYGGETFVSEEVAIALLQESKSSFQRCQLLSSPSDLPGNALQITNILLKHLITGHIDYALELGLQTIPIPETKNFPQIYFFDIVRRTNAIVHLLEKLFSDSIVPLVISTPKYNECLTKKKSLLELVEMKLDSGLDKSINSIVSAVKIYLQNEQKKTDFKPETDNLHTLSSPACLTVVQYISNTAQKIRESLDDKNSETVLMELGTRFHRVIYEHLQQYQFNTAGAMCAICDVNEYRKCVKKFKITLVDTLFETLHGLCNLLLVKPENLKQVCNGDQLVGLERSILLNFVQLRSDYKSQKISNSLKGLTS